MRLLAILSLFAFAAVTVSAGNVVCYFTSWTTYRLGNGKFIANDVDPNLCTHVMYAFVGLGDDGSVKILDDWEFNGLGEYQRLMALKQQNPKLKVLVSMGGWNEGSRKYSTVAASPALRANNVQNVLAFLAKYGFDGFDLDWEYPAQRDGSPADKENYVIWLRELKTALSARGYLLTAAVSASAGSIDTSYNVPGVSQYLDLINVMSYDYHGAQDPVVGHNAPLYASSLDQTNEQRQLNVAAGIRHWINRGADPRKIVLGVPSYGHTYTLADPSNNGLYARTAGAGQQGPYTKTNGMIGYNEICELYSNWQYVWDAEQQVPHRINGNQWFGYDDERSIRAKVEFAKSLKLGGVMMWSLDTDDFKGRCGQRYPLLRVLNEYRNF